MACKRKTHGSAYLGGQDRVRPTWLLFRVSHRFGGPHRLLHYPFLAPLVHNNPGARPDTAICLPHVLRGTLFDSSCLPTVSFFTQHNCMMQAGLLKSPVACGPAVRRSTGRRVVAKVRAVATRPRYGVRRAENTPPPSILSNSRSIWAHLGILTTLYRGMECLRVR